MGIALKITFPMIFSMLLVAGAALLLAGCSSQPQDNGQYVALAKCMSEKGAIMYGTSWCPHCQNQKKEFGSAFQYINFVDCDANPDKCQAAGVRGYPTWAISGANLEGEQSLYDLAKSSGCVDALINGSNTTGAASAATG